MKSKKISEKEKKDDVYEFNEVDENDPKTKTKKKRKILKIKKIRAKKGNTEANLIQKAEKKVLINAHIKHKKTLTESEKMDINDFNTITQPKKVKSVIPQKKVLRSALKEKDKNIINEKPIIEDKQVQFSPRVRNENKPNHCSTPSQTPRFESVPNYCSTPNKTPRYESQANFNCCSPIPITYDNRSMKAPMNSTPLYSTDYNPSPIQGNLNSNRSIRVPNSTPLYAPTLESDFNDDISIKNASCYTPIKYHNDSYSIINPKGFDLSNCFGFDAPETTMPQLSPAVKKLPVIRLVEKPKLNMPSAQEVIQQLRNEVKELETSNVESDIDTDVSRFPGDKSTVDSEDSEFPKSVFEPVTIADFETSVRPPRRSYERQIRPRKKILICDTLEDDYAESSEGEEFIKPKIFKKKGKKNQKGPAKEKPNPAMDKWVKEFNKHCQEVEQFGLCVE